MNRSAPMVLALCFSLFNVPIVADDGGAAGFGNQGGGDDKTAGGNQTEEGTSVKAGDSQGGESGDAASNGKPAGTGTAAGYIYDQVKKGNVKIHGATDTEIPLTQ